MTTTPDVYNGWANYPTWCVNLWLSNEQLLYAETLERVREAVESLDGESPADYWTFDDACRYQCADTLCKWVNDDLTPDLGASFPADLLGWALSYVDWEEIASAWLETLKEQVSA